MGDTQRRPWDDHGACHSQLLPAQLSRPGPKGKGREGPAASGSASSRGPQASGVGMQHAGPCSLHPQHPAPSSAALGRALL